LAQIWFAHRNEVNENAVTALANAGQIATEAWTNVKATFSTRTVFNRLSGLRRPATEQFFQIP